MPDLTERQKSYLRLVARGHSTFEIARIETADGRPVSPPAVNKQMAKAMAYFGVSSRQEAARRLLAQEAGVEQLYPPSATPVAHAVHLLPLPLPTEAAPRKVWTRAQVLAWGSIIAIGSMLTVLLAVLLLEALTTVIGGGRRL